METAPCYGEDYTLRGNLTEEKKQQMQQEEYFVDSGYYKYHEAYHLLKFPNEKQILEKAYNEYLELKKSNLWGNHKYF